MKLFNFFRKKKEPEAKVEDQKIYSSAELEEWPSQPGEDKKVPSIDVLLNQQSEIANHAKSLVAKCEKMRKEGDLLEYQVVMESQFGLFSIPAMIRRESSGDFLVFYSFTSEWTEEAVQKLLNWVICVRSCDFIHTFKIIICDSTYDIPKQVTEIISKRTVDRMMISMVPHLRKSEPKINARVFIDAFAFYFNDKKILSYNQDCLEQVEIWYRDVVRSCVKNSFFYPFYVHFVAAYFGQVICESFKVDWDYYSGVNIVVIPPSKLKPRKNGMMPGEMKVNILQICSDFICNPRPENSLVTNFKMVKAEILKEA